MSADTHSPLNDALTGLGLAADAWTVLLALPLAERFGEVPDEGGAVAVGLAEFGWGRGLSAATKADVLRLLIGLNETDPRRDTARRVLAWSLARRLDFHARERYFEQLRAAAGRQLVRPGPGGEWIAELYARLVDEYLPLTEFALRPPDVPPARVEVGGLFPGAAWSAFLPTCLVDRRGPPETMSSALAAFTNRLTYRLSLPTKAALPGLRMMEGMWRVLAASGELNASWLEQAEHLVASGLATLPYDRRREVLATVEALAVVSGTASRLREQIDRQRRVAPLPPEEPVAADQAFAAMAEAVPPPPPPSVAPLVWPSILTVSTFTPLGLEEARALARQTSVADVAAWLESGSPLLFDDHREECAAVAIVRDPGRVPRSLWVVGDLHADLLALANIWSHVSAAAREEGEEPALVFLGDFIDRGAEDHDTLLLLFHLIRTNPGRVAVLAGNHDLELYWDDVVGRFRSRVEPAEYARRLNGLLAGGADARSDEVQLGKLFERFIRHRPRALFLPDGTLLTHGGFPHTDLIDGLKTPADLGRGRCPQDFTWLRIAETAERKRPNPGNKGCQFGWGDLARFADACGRIGVPMRRLVRGHDHVPERYEFYPHYRAYPALTVNAMSWRGDGEHVVSTGPAVPCVARHTPGRLPDVIRLPLSSEGMRAS